MGYGRFILRAGRRIAARSGPIYQIRPKRQELGGERLSTVAKEAAEKVLVNVKSRFMRMITPDHTPWTPSKSGERRLREGRGQTLYDTGRLYRGFEARQEPGGIAVIRNKVEYAQKHDEGLDGNIKRQFMGFAQEDYEVLREHALKKFRGQVQKRVDEINASI